jgi:hypothetical protein
MDFGSPQEIFAVVIWHAHNSAKVYHDVIIQIADDQDFLQNVKTIFNNDQDNTSGLGVGTDREFFEIHEGKLIDTKGVAARYIRFYSKGSTESASTNIRRLKCTAGRPNDPFVHAGSTPNSRRRFVLRWADLNRRPMHNDEAV